MGIEAFLVCLVFLPLHTKSQSCPLLLSSDCCARKTVGGILYTQVAGDTSQYPECIPDCVYERVDSPGSLFCFQSGNINNNGGEVECKEPERKVGTTSVKIFDREDGVTDWVAFDLGGNNVLNCTIGIPFGSSGGNVTMLENVKCSNISDVTDLFPSTRQGGDFAHTAEYENNLEFHLPEFTIACTICTINVKGCGCSAYIGQVNVLYVQESFVDIKDQTECKKNCSNTANCTFWSFSATEHYEDHEDHDHHNGRDDNDDLDHHIRIKRNHQNISQCGIRTYQAEKCIIIKRPEIKSLNLADIEYVNDTRQRCGRPNKTAPVYKAQVFVQEAFRPSSPKSCSQAAHEDPIRWKFWTWSAADGTCVLANYKPDTKIQLPIFPLLFGVISGMSDPDLLASFGPLAEEGTFAKPSI